MSEVNTSKPSSPASSWFHKLICGSRDALNVKAIHRVFSGNNQVSVKFVDIVVFNFVLNFGSLFVFQNFCEPFIASLFLQTQRIGFNSFLSSFGFYYHYVVLGLFYGLWAVPVFLISFILNGHWLSVISDAATLILTPPSSSSKKSSVGLDERTISRALAKQVFATTFPIMIVFQSTLSSFIPFLGPFVTIVICAWLYSLYCFDYKWKEENPEKKFKYIEDNLAYFTGFGMIVGLPFTLATVFLGFWIGYAIWFLCFPLFVITAIGSNEPLVLIKDEEAQPKWRAFILAKGLNRFFINFSVVFIHFLTGGRKVKST